MQDLEEHPGDVSLLAVLRACDSHKGEFPSASLLAPGLSLIALGLPLVTAQLEAMVERGEHLPPELDRVANMLFNRGTTALSMLHRLTLED